MRLRRRAHVTHRECIFRPSHSWLVIKTRDYFGHKKALNNQGFDIE
ncbi:hypothetical protein QWZ13_01245 [Reinekea marina]|nr:hypothetical protein [Reinekea marina]MDN3647528.1 hypothetical protein [Reinekea marina]